MALAPRVERAVVIGIGLAVAIHLWRELEIEERWWTEGEALHLRPTGVLWFGDAREIQDNFLARLHEHSAARAIVLHLDGIGRLNVTGALVVRVVLEQGRRLGLETKLVGVEPRDRRLVEGIVEREGGSARRVVQAAGWGER